MRALPGVLCVLAIPGLHQHSRLGRSDDNLLLIGPTRQARASLRRVVSSTKQPEHIREPTHSTSLAVALSALHAPRWVHPIANYDNIGLATFTLWQISTTELWVNTMYAAIAAVGADQQPRDGHNPALALFFIAFIIFGGGCLLELHGKFPGETFDV